MQISMAIYNLILSLLIRYHICCVTIMVIFCCCAILILFSCDLCRRHSIVIETYIIMYNNQLSPFLWSQSNMIFIVSWFFVSNLTSKSTQKYTINTCTKKQYQRFIILHANYHWIAYVIFVFLCHNITNITLIICVIAIIICTKNN